MGVIAFFGSVIYLSVNSAKFVLAKELDAIKFPSNYYLVDKEYVPGGIDNHALLKYRYDVSGTREDVFQQVVKSLGLNPEEHKESYDQELHEVGSPIYKYTYFLTIYPLDNKIIDNDPCLVNGAGDLEWKACKNRDPKRGKNLQAEHMELTIIKR